MAYLTSSHLPYAGWAKKCRIDSGHHWLQSSPKQVDELVVIIIQPLVNNVPPSFLCCWLYHSLFKVRLGVHAIWLYWLCSPTLKKKDRSGDFLNSFLSVSIEQMLRILLFFVTCSGGERVRGVSLPYPGAESGRSGPSNTCLDSCSLALSSMKIQGYTVIGALWEYIRNQDFQKCLWILKSQTSGIYPEKS